MEPFNKYIMKYKLYKVHLQAPKKEPGCSPGQNQCSETTTLLCNSDMEQLKKVNF